MFGSKCNPFNWYKEMTISLGETAHACHTDPKNGPKNGQEAIWVKMEPEKLQYYFFFLGEQNDQTALARH